MQINVMKSIGSMDLVVKEDKKLVKYKTSNATNEINENNLSNLNLLNEEVKKLIRNKWIYIKNKKVYYNNDLVALFPELNTFVIGYCPAYNKFDDRSLKLRFGEYQGRVMTYQELLSILDDDGCIQKIQFYNYTVFLNGIKWVDKDERKILMEFNSNNPYLSYIIPIFKLESGQPLIDENGYDLKYVDERKSILNLLEIINLWLKYDLIPDGLSQKAEEIYKNLLLLGDRKMKIAMPKDGEIINQHFGKSKSFEIITLDENKVVESKEISAETLQHNHGGLSELLVKEGVSLVVTGGIGKGALDALKAKKLEIIRGASGKINDIVESYLKGDLKDKEVICNHHEHHHNDIVRFNK